MTLKLLPCPVCGRQLGPRDIHWWDNDGEYIGDLEMIHDLDDLLDPSNGAHPEDWARMDEQDRRVVGSVYLESLRAVETISVYCDCGYRMKVDRWKFPSFPEEGWLAEFEDEVNARSLIAMLQSLDLIVEEHEGCDRDAARIAQTAFEFMRHQLYSTLPIGRMCEELRQVRAEIDEVLEAWSR